MQDPIETGNADPVVRTRRPTRQHRRNRLIRRLLWGTIAAVLTFGVVVPALRYLSPSLFHRSSTPVRIPVANTVVVQTQQDVLRSAEGRLIYPYSVVPGGVRDAQELKWAADHDPVVAAHYAGFDYEHAQVFRLVMARTAYVSYRIGNKVYWTRRRVKLKKGETVISDGKMTARTRCANRVEEVPQKALSNEEPSATKLDQPGHLPGSATSNPPVPFESSLLSHPGVPGFGPTSPLSFYEPLGGGSLVPFAPPPLPIGVCDPGKKHEISGEAGKKKKPNPCGNTGGGGGGGEVPEPGTWLLAAAGSAMVFWMSRRRLSRS